MQLNFPRGLASLLKPTGARHVGKQLQVTVAGDQQEEVESDEILTGVCLYQSCFLLLSKAQVSRVVGNKLQVCGAPWCSAAPNYTRSFRHPHLLLGSQSQSHTTAGSCKVFNNQLTSPYPLSCQKCSLSCCFLFAGLLTHATTRCFRACNTDHIFLK